MNKNESSSRFAASKPSFHLHKADHDPRAAALGAVSRVLAGEADAQDALDAALQSSVMVPSDKGLCTELLYGHLRMYLRLHWFSRRFLKKPEKLPWEMRLCLDQALYSMAFLRMPQRAAVHWAVEHVRNRFGKGLAGVANGALRSMQRELASFKTYKFYQDNHADDMETQASWHAMPVWIVRLWNEAYGPEKARALLEASASAPPRGLRLNRARSGWEERLAAFLHEDEARHKGQPKPPQAVGKCALLFERSLPHEARRLIQEGSASRQSAASYAVLEAFEPRLWPQPVWDCCAGRGGKTMALLEQGVAVALASDPSARRLAALTDEYVRLGLVSPPCPLTLTGSPVDEELYIHFLRHVNEPSQNSASPYGFGTILVDAPCSGLGTMSRYPEIRLRRAPEDCAALVQLQQAILDAAWVRLLPGGRLVYITCTANPAENGEQVQAFIARHDDASLVQEYEGGDWELFGEYFYGAMLRKG